MSSNNMVFLGTAYVNVDNLAGLVIGGEPNKHAYRVIFLPKDRNEKNVSLFESRKKSECAKFLELVSNVLKDQNDKGAAEELKKFVFVHAESVDSEEIESSHNTASASFDAKTKKAPKEDKESKKPEND